jgi:hypothetical protein
MRKLIVDEFMSLDGVVQGPSSPDEDTDGGFEHGGWHVPYLDETAMQWTLGNVTSAGAEDFLTGGFVFDLATHGHAGHKLADELEPITRDGEGGQHQNTIRTRLLSHGNHGASRLGHHRSSGAKDADDGVGSLHGLGDHCAVGCVALDNVEVRVGQGEGLRGPSKCRDLVASDDCLLDQRNAGGAGGAQDGEVHGSAPFIPGMSNETT